MKKPKTLGNSFWRINVKILILSVFSASSFWLLNALNKRYTTRLSLPVLLEHQVEDLVAVKSPPEEISLSLTGIGWDLLRQKNWLQPRPLLVPLASPTETKLLSRSFLLNMLSEQLHPLRLNHIIDPDLQIDFQARNSRRIALSLDSLHIPLCHSCRIYSPIALSTDSITLSGAASYVANFPDILSIHLDSRTQIDDTFEKAMIDIRLPHKDVLQAHPSEVEVSFSVGRYEQKEIKARIEQLNFPQRGRFKAILSDSLLRVQYTVRSDLALSVKAEHFTVIADYKKRDRSDRSITPEIIYAPQEATDIDIEPKLLKLQYIRR